MNMSVGDSVLCPDLSFHEHHAQEKGISHESESGWYHPDLLGIDPRSDHSHRCYSSTHRDHHVVCDRDFLSSPLGNREDRSNA